MQSLRLSRTVAMIFIAFLAVISGMATAAPASSASFREAGIYGYDGVTQVACGASASGCSSCVADPRVAVEGQVSSPLNSGCIAGFGVAANTASRAGWSVGDDIYSVTRAGNSPSWSTVRARFWKNEAASPRYGAWTDEQLARMGTGRAPQRFNPDKGGIESMDLSHEPIPFRDGGTNVVPRWPQDHAAVDPFRHPGY